MYILSIYSKRLFIISKESFIFQNNMATKIDNDNKKPCPWGQIQNKAPVCSFTTLMDEDYAKELQSKEAEFEEPIATEIVTLPTEVLDEVASNDQDDETANDLLLAKMLQLEFDKENDEYVKSLEKTYNGTNKVSMSFKNFCAVHPYNSTEQTNDWEDYSSEGEEDDSDEYELNERKADGEIITKHDQQVSERKNARNIEQFPIHFASGDVGRKDIRVPNSVYNQLKTHSKKEERNAMRIHEKQEYSTHEKALDEKARLILYKMVNNGTLDSISGIVSTGKEAVVLHARGGQSDSGPLPSECALKIFKTTLNEFKTREKYIKDDHRFRDRFTKQNPRKIIKLWAEKEFRNLNRMQEAGINCPKVFCLRKQILVMTFIGTEEKPAPKLKDAFLSRSQLEQAYDHCQQMMQALYQKCNLIHSDLSEYNILWHRDRCYFIDVSQSIEPVHPQAFHFLLRDCTNITSFFTKAGLSDYVMKADELFTFVCGKELKTTSLDELEKQLKPDFEKDKELLAFGLHRNDSDFDYKFTQTQTEPKLSTENVQEPKIKEEEDGNGDGKTSSAS